MGNPVQPNDPKHDQKPSIWARIVSSGWTRPKGVATALAVLSTAVVGIPTVIGNIVMTVHIATDKGSAPSTWAIIPGIPTPIPIGIAATIWFFLVALTFFYPGIAASFAPIDEDAALQIRGYDFPRLSLFATMLISLITWGAVAFGSFHVFKLTIPAWTILLPVIFGWSAGMIAASVRRGAITAFKAYGFRFAVSAVYWLVAASTISQIMNAVATHQQWNWNKSFLPWEYLVALLIGSTTATLFAAHRKPMFAFATAGMMVMMLVGLDAKDLFAAPFRMLHLS